MHISSRICKISYKSRDSRRKLLPLQVCRLVKNDDEMAKKYKKDKFYEEVLFADYCVGLCALCLLA